MEGRGDLPVLRFGAEAAPAEHQFELFHETTAPLFDTAPIGSPEVFTATAVDYQLDDAVVSRLRHGPQALRRNGSHLRDDEDRLAVLVPLRGSLRGRVGGTHLDLDDHHVAVVDLARPFRVVCDDLEVIWVVLPRRHVGGPAARRLDGCARFHRSSPRGRLLAAFVVGLWDRLPTITTTGAPTVVAQVADVVRSVLEAGDLRPAAAGMAAVVRSHVDDHLDDLDLDAGTLMARFACSRATLYRLFEDAGGVATYVRERRLQRCLAELLAPEPRVLVSQVATRWGFENPSHFNRVFRARYGMAPSEVTRRWERSGTAGFDGSTQALVDEFHRWTALG